MKINLSKKNVIILVADFLAGVIVAASCFLICSSIKHSHHKHKFPSALNNSPSYSSQGTNNGISRDGKGGNSSSPNQSKKNKSGSNKSQTSDSESNTNKTDNANKTDNTKES